MITLGGIILSALFGVAFGCVALVAFNAGQKVRQARDNHRKKRKK